MYPSVLSLVDRTAGWAGVMGYKCVGCVSGRCWYLMLVSLVGCTAGSAGAYDTRSVFAWLKISLMYPLVHSVVDCTAGSAGVVVGLVQWEKHQMYPMVPSHADCTAGSASA